MGRRKAGAPLPDPVIQLNADIPVCLKIEICAIAKAQNVKLREVVISALQREVVYGKARIGKSNKLING